ncbi:hypothetical protein FALCPG4_012095 [Fusarium falciforme]
MVLGRPKSRHGVLNWKILIDVHAGFLSAGDSQPRLCATYVQRSRCFRHAAAKSLGKLEEGWLISRQWACHDGLTSYFCLRMNHSEIDCSVASFHCSSPPICVHTNGQIRDESTPISKHRYYVRAVGSKAGAPGRTGVSRYSTRSSLQPCHDASGNIQEIGIRSSVLNLDIHNPEWTEHRDVNETVSRVDVNLHYGDFSGRLMGHSPRSGTGGAVQSVRWNLDVGVMSCAGPSIYDGIFKRWSGQFSQSDPIADIQGSCFPCLPTWRQRTRLSS